MRCLRAKVWRYSSSVQNCLVRVILGFSAIRIFVSSTSLICRVELMFSDGSPASRADRRLQLRHAAVQLDGVFGQRRGVDPHARHLDRGQHLDHRLLDLGIEPLQPDPLDHRVEHALELQRDVGVLGGVLLDTLDVHQIHSSAAVCPLPMSVLDRDGPVIEVLLRKRVRCMPGADSGSSR